MYTCFSKGEVTVELYINSGYACCIPTYRVLPHSLIIRVKTIITKKKQVLPSDKKRTERTGIFFNTDTVTNTSLKTDKY